MFERQDNSEGASFTFGTYERDAAAHYSSELGANAKSKTGTTILLAQA